MFLHCLKCRKNTETKIPNFVRTKNKCFCQKGRVPNSEKSKFIKEQEATGLLSSWGIKTTFK